MTNPRQSRRSFLRTAGVCAAVLVLPERLLADPYATFETMARGPARRIRGRVHTAGRGLAGVGVTDGFSTVTTDRDGRYSLIAHPRARFVSVRLPAGYEIPVQKSGTARLHQAIPPAGRADIDATFALTKLRVSDASHTLLLLADPQTQNAFEMNRLHSETVPDVRETIRALGDRHVFGVACGDIMYDDLTLYPEYERAVTASGIPFFQVVGNHDLDQTARTDEESVATFESHFGPGHYSFDRGEVHYVVLDDVFWYGNGYIGYLDGDQLAWLAGDLTLVEAGRTVVVCLHIPLGSTRPDRTRDHTLDTNEKVTNRDALYRLLEPYAAHVLAGHTHEAEHVLAGKLQEHVHGAVCGAWWSGDICWDGTPNGYGLYEVNGSEVRWRYKGTGQPAEQQLRLYRPGADPAAPGDVIANVWNWDPGWTVVWYEGADRRGALSRHVALDPLSVKTQAGPTLPPRRTWVEPTPTSHLFSVTLPRGARDVQVVARDRWGQEYRARL